MESLLSGIIEFKSLPLGDRRRGFILQFLQPLAIKKLKEKQEVTLAFQIFKKVYECLIFSGIYSPTI